MMQVAAYDIVRANAQYRSALIAATSAVLDSGELILGTRLRTFEDEFARYCGTQHCVGTGNGLDALMLILRAMGVQAGDEVIVPAFTFVATWLAASQIGARPVPVDVGFDGLINPSLIAAAITPRTRAIIPVHLYGAIADVETILDIADNHQLMVIEDAAQAHGAQWLGKRAGSFGSAAAFSFYPAKNLGAIGDGGAICTDDLVLADRCRQLRNYGSTEKYRHETLGLNSRLDELQAVYLSLKLPHLDAVNRRRRHVAAIYAQKLANLPGLDLPEMRASSVWHQFVIRSMHRDALQIFLKTRSIGTAIHYPVAPFDQPCFAGLYDRTLFPVAVHLSKTVLSLPIGDYLGDEEIQHVTDAILDEHQCWDLHQTDELHRTCATAPLQR